MGCVSATVAARAGFDVRCPLRHALLVRLENLRQRDLMKMISCKVRGGYECSVCSGCSSVEVVGVAERYVLACGRFIMNILEIRV